MTALKRPRLDLYRERDPRRRDRHAVDITAAAVARASDAAATPPPPAQRERAAPPPPNARRYGSGRQGAPNGERRRTSRPRPATALPRPPNRRRSRRSRRICTPPAPRRTRAAARRRRRYCWRRGKLQTGIIGGSHPAQTEFPAGRRSRADRLSLARRVAAGQKRMSLTWSCGPRGRRVSVDPSSVGKGETPITESRL